MFLSLEIFVLNVIENIKLYLLQNLSSKFKMKISVFNCHKTCIMDLDIRGSNIYQLIYY